MKALIVNGGPEEISRLIQLLPFDWQNPEAPEIVTAKAAPKSDGPDTLTPEQMERLKGLSARCRTDGNLRQIVRAFLTAEGVSKLTDLTCEQTRRLFALADGQEVI